MREIQVMKNQRERRPNERGLLKHHVHIMTACMLSFAIVRSLFEYIIILYHNQLDVILHASTVMACNM